MTGWWTLLQHVSKLEWQCLIILSVPSLHSISGVAMVTRVQVSMLLHVIMIMSQTILLILTVKDIYILQKGGELWSPCWHRPKYTNAALTYGQTCRQGYHSGCYIAYTIRTSTATLLAH